MQLGEHWTETAKAVVIYPVQGYLWSKDYKQISLDTIQQPPNEGQG